MEENLLDVFINELKTNPTFYNTDELRLLDRLIAEYGTEATLGQMLVILAEKELDKHLFTELEE